MFHFDGTPGAKGAGALESMQTIQSLPLNQTQLRGSIPAQQKL